MKILEEEYKKLEKFSTPEEKLNVINTIIQIKIDESLSSDNRLHNIGRDLKVFINTNIEALDQSNFKYDRLHLNQFLDLIQKLCFEEKIEIIDYFIRKLQIGAYTKYISNLQKLKSCIIIERCYKKPFSLSSLIDFFVYFPTHSNKNLILSLIIVAFLASTITLPAPIQIMGWLNFKIVYVQYSKTFYVNHILNVTSTLVGIDDGFKVIALNQITQVFKIAGKLFVYVFIGSILYTKLIENLKNEPT